MTKNYRKITKKELYNEYTKGDTIRVLYKMADFGAISKEKLNIKEDEPLEYILVRKNILYNILKLEDYESRLNRQMERGEEIDPRFLEIER